MRFVFIILRLRLVCLCDDVDVVWISFIDSRSRSNNSRQPGGSIPSYISIAALILD
jgi:hypothetical protein